MPAHPNELDMRRIEKLLDQRQRYRYVAPEVIAIAGGYQVISPCCSRNIDRDGGPIDIARLEFDAEAKVWRLYRKNHAAGQWELHLCLRELHAVVAQLNEDPERRFWQ